eukprot:TRINITY_DN14760_c0_g1_i1.p1 TRINITY_DN14760_c0_g1~~TRINITY_DN14760_c0_g1_i1.p1  ORF type:complete len:615 (+),score=146.70 TRINITY_DN14760_c0_g1_i1:76-1920(+)
MSEVDHQFKKHHFNKPTWCDRCDQFIWGLGKQGYYCKACKYGAHPKCYKKVTDECTGRAKELSPSDSSQDGTGEKRMSERLEMVASQVTSKYLNEIEVRVLLDGFTTTFNDSASRTEIVRYFSHISSRLAEHLYRVLDGGSDDGHIDFKEWLCVVEIVARGTMDERLGLVFKLLDGDRDGCINFQEATSVLTELADYLSSISRGLLDKNECVGSIDALKELFDGSDELPLEDFKMKCQNIDAIRNCYAIFEIAFGGVVGRLQRATGNFSRVFGGDLLDLLRREREEKGSTSGIPIVVERTTEFLRKGKNMTFQGLFRVSGSLDQFLTIRDQFDRGEDVSFDGVSPLNAARLLKTFFRELPDPLFTFTLYPSLIAIVSKSEVDSWWDNESSEAEEIGKLMTSLPVEYSKLLRYLTTFLLEVAQLSDKNRMDVHNLATLFAPSLLRPRTENPVTMVKELQPQIAVVETMLSNSDTVFANITDVEVDSLSRLDSTAFTIVEENVMLKKEVGELREEMVAMKAELEKAREQLAEKDRALEDLRRTGGVKLQKKMQRESSLNLPKLKTHGGQRSPRSKSPGLGSRIGSKIGLGGPSGGDAPKAASKEEDEAKSPRKAEQ